MFSTTQHHRVVKFECIAYGDNGACFVYRTRTVHVHACKWAAGHITFMIRVSLHHVTGSPNIGHARHVMGTAHCLRLNSIDNNN